MLLCHTITHDLINIQWFMCLYCRYNMVGFRLLTVLMSASRCPTALQFTSVCCVDSSWLYKSRMLADCRYLLANSLATKIISSLTTCYPAQYPAQNLYKQNKPLLTQTHRIFSISQKTLSDIQVVVSYSIGLYQFWLTCVIYASVSRNKVRIWQNPKHYKPSGNSLCVLVNCGLSVSGLLMLNCQSHSQQFRTSLHLI